MGQPSHNFAVNISRERLKRFCRTNSSLRYRTMASVNFPQHTGPNRSSSTSPNGNKSQAIPKLMPRSRRKSAASAPADPVPETPLLPPPPQLDSVQFKTPVKRILSPADHEKFLASPTYTLIRSWIFTLADCVEGRPSSSLDLSTVSAEIRRLDAALDVIKKLLERYPPLDTGSRFGNPVFRDLHKAIVRDVERLHEEELGLQNKAAIQEISVYLINSFGSEERLDYGSGHELNFMMWLLCLYQLGEIRREGFPAIVMHTFNQYLELMRKIQSMYYLEPAGSHGVWGLDDYQFLPFLFGSSQLLHHPFIRPLSIHQNLILEEYGNDYLYLGQVNFVNSVKNVEGLRWHSPMLDDISSAKSWSKVEAGMRRMFVAEVLKKLPVKQHFLFGSLVPAVEEMSTEEDFGVPSEEEDPEGGETVVMVDGMRHVHQMNSWGDCCVYLSISKATTSCIAVTEETMPDVKPICRKY